MYIQINASPATFNNLFLIKDNMSFNVTKLVTFGMLLLLRRQYMHVTGY